jgi:hypothetical protein
MAEFPMPAGPCSQKTVWSSSAVAHWVISVRMLSRAFFGQAAYLPAIVFGVLLYLNTVFLLVEGRFVDVPGLLEYLKLFFGNCEMLLHLFDDVF